MLTAQAALPLEIENTGLGYKLFFDLKKFSASATDFTIVGNIRFVNLDAPDTLTARRWLRNREQAYRGSLRHLLKAALDGSVQRVGFALYREKQPGKPHSTNFTVDLQSNLVAVETSPAVMPGKRPNQRKIALPGYWEVHYTDGFVTDGFYKDISYPVSWLHVRGDTALVDTDGNLLNPTDMIVSGSMADERVSGLLPLDYQVDNATLPSTVQTRQMARLREKVYLHTDRPYYDPGQTLWFSAYMTHRVTALRDSLSDVLYVELLTADGSVARQQMLPVSAGRAGGAVRLPDSPGNYTLRAYTQWMQSYGVASFFYKPILVLPLDKRVSKPPSVPVPDSLISVTIDRLTYEKRSPVSLTIRLNTANRPVAGSFSVSVFDETRTVPIAEPVSIATSTGFSTSAEALPGSFAHPIQKGITLNGVFTDKKGRSKKATFSLIPQNMGAIYPVTTPADGSFSLTKLYFQDSATFVIQPPVGAVRFVARTRPRLPEKLPTLTLPLTNATPRPSYAPDTTNTKTLAQVVVTAKKTNAPRINTPRPT